MRTDKKGTRSIALLKYALCLPLFMLMLGISTAMAQTETPKQPQQTEIVIDPPKTSANTAPVYKEVDKAAEFPGGVQKFYEFLSHNIQYPSKARQNNVQGRVILTFVVEEDGSLTGFKVLRDIGDGAGEETVRVMSLSPKWVPATVKGHTVREQYVVPIAFTLPDAKKG